MDIAKKALFNFLIAIFAIVIFSPVAIAKTDSAEACRKNFFGMPTWYQYLELDDKCNVKTLGEKNVPEKIILGLIDIALFLAGLLAVIMIMWGGFQFIFANGESGTIANARKTILNAVIGLIIAILASQIVRFVAYLLSK